VSLSGLTVKLLFGSVVFVFTVVSLRISLEKMFMSKMTGPLLTPTNFNCDGSMLRKAIILLKTLN
jgi:hypothetical protein